MAYATKAELIGLNTLETIAAAMAKKYPVGTRIRPVINAQRQQLFCGQYVVAALGGVEQVAENEILSREDWLSSLVDDDVVTGSGLAPLLDALAVVHASDFLHRDIAPDNIIIRNDGSPVLIDFGAARGDIAQHSRTVSALVKPGYSAYFRNLGLGFGVSRRRLATMARPLEDVVITIRP